MSEASPAAHPRGISIASEVIDHIISFIADKKTLIDCALVARAWLPASRFLAISKPGIIITAHRHRSNLSLIEIIASPKATLPTYLTHITFRESLYHGDPEAEDKMNIFNDTCRHLAHISLTSLKMVLHYNPRAPPRQFWLMEFLSRSTRTLRSLAIYWTQDIRVMNRSFFDTLSECSALERLLVQRDILFDQTCALETLPQQGPPALRVITVSAWSPPQSGVPLHGINLLLTWLSQSSPLEHLEELVIEYEAQLHSIASFLDRTPKFTNRLRVLRMTVPSFLASSTPTTFSLKRFVNLQILDALVDLFLDEDVYIGDLDYFFRSLDTFPAQHPPHGRSRREVRLNFGPEDSFTHWQDDTLSVVDQALSVFAIRFTDVNVFASMHFPASSEHPRSKELAFALCSGMSMPFTFSWMRNNWAKNLEDEKLRQRSGPEERWPWKLTLTRAGV